MSEIINVTKQDVDNLERFVTEGRQKYISAETLVKSLEEQQEKERGNLRLIGINPDNAAEDLKKLELEISDLYQQGLSAKAEAERILAEAGR